MAPSELSTKLQRDGFDTPEHAASVGVAAEQCETPRRSALGKKKTALLASFF